MSKKSSGKSNSQRSNVKNPNNPAYRHAQSNRGTQLNPKHRNHGGSSGKGRSSPKK